MNKTAKIVFSSLLVLLFSFFSVGVPVVQYLCPMMSAENPSCDMSPASNPGQLTISTETPSCCAKKLGAERNTTPFLKVDKVQTFSFDVISSTPVIEPVLQPTSIGSINPSLYHPSSPLFLLNSVFLI
ncbi:MAG: hypothetical protein AABZ41_06550 [Bacteroidota bacterium]